MKPAVVQLSRPLERAVSSGHPWIYRDALRSAPPPPGGAVTVLDRKGRFLARGISDQGPIALRVWTTVDEPVNGQLLRRRLQDAADLRRRVVPADTTAFRLVHGEGDRMPAIVCDRYGDSAVIRFDGAAGERFLDLLVDGLGSLGVTSAAVRAGRGEDKTFRVVLGDLSEEVLVAERGMQLAANLRHGQKTGLFLDHRESRFAIRSLAKGLRTLNLYGYTGGFSVAAGLGGATEVVTVDTSTPALRMADRSWSANGLPAVHEAVAEDVPKCLARYQVERRRFDLIVSDPPSFAPNAKAIHSAQRSYGKLHEACFRLLEPGGYCLAASCSSHIDRRAFRESLVEGARRARASVQILDEWGAAPDHPRLLSFPEGDYLKVVLLRRL